MKTIIFFTLIFVCLTGMAQKKQVQDDLYYSPQMKAAKKDALKPITDIQVIQSNLKKYYNERQIAFALCAIGFLGAGIGTAMIKENEKTAGSAYIFSGLFTFSSMVVFYDSEKWLKRASVSISPTSLKINF